MKRLITAILFFCCNSAFAGGGIPPEKFTDAVRAYLSWEKRWYGTFFGENCLSKINGDTKIFVDNSSKANNFSAYVEKTNIFLFGPNGEDLSHMEIGAGDPTTCSPGEFQDIFSSIKKNSPQEISLNLPMHLDVGMEFMQPPDASTCSKVVSAIREKTTSNASVIIGLIKKTDPYIIAATADLTKVYLVELAGNNVKLFSSDRYMGTDVSIYERKKQREYLVEKLKKHSVLIH